MWVRVSRRAGNPQGILSNPLPLPKGNLRVARLADAIAKVDTDNTRGHRSGHERRIRSQPKPRSAERRHRATRARSGCAEPRPVADPADPAGEWSAGSAGRQPAADPAGERVRAA